MAQSLIFGPSRHDFLLWRNALLRELRQFGVSREHVMSPAELHDSYYVERLTVAQAFKRCRDMAEKSA